MRMIKNTETKQRSSICGGLVNLLWSLASLVTVHLLPTAANLFIWGEFHNEVLEYSARTGHGDSFSSRLDSQSLNDHKLACSLAVSCSLHVRSNMVYLINVMPLYQCVWR